VLFRKFQTWNLCRNILRISAERCYYIVQYTLALGSICDVAELFVKLDVCIEGVQLMINTTSDIWKMCQNCMSRRGECNLAHFTNVTSVLIINCTTCPCDYLFIICMTKSLSLKFNCILSRVFNSLLAIWYKQTWEMIIIYKLIKAHNLN
jgi:hypothetical protein